MRDHKINIKSIQSNLQGLQLNNPLGLGLKINKPISKYEELQTQPQTQPKTLNNLTNFHNINSLYLNQQQKPLKSDRSNSKAQTTKLNIQDINPIINTYSNNYGDKNNKFNGTNSSSLIGGLTSVPLSQTIKKKDPQDKKKDDLSGTINISNNPKKVFQQSSVQEIHNNVYNFFPATSDLETFIKKGTLVNSGYNPSMTSENKSFSMKKNISKKIINRNSQTDIQDENINTKDAIVKYKATINEKQEYINFLINENEILKKKLKEKTNENKILLTKAIDLKSDTKIDSNFQIKGKFTQANSPKNSKLNKSDCKVFLFRF